MPLAKLLVLPSGARAMLTPEDEAKVQQVRAQRAHDQEQRSAKIEAMQRTARVMDLRKLSSVPERYQDAVLTDNPDAPKGYRELAEQLHGTLDGPGMLALIGPRGTGKTHLSCALVNAACEAGAMAIYRRTIDLFTELKVSFGVSGAADQLAILHKYERPRLLVLDEFQVRSDTEWENMVLTDLLDRRYAAMKTTVLIANLTPAEFVKRAGESVVSRMQETGGIVLCDWPSFRAK